MSAPLAHPASPAPISVKFVARGKGGARPDLWTRQFPGRQPVWGRCEFFFDPALRDYDWLVVYDDMPSLDGERFSRHVESLPCPANHTVLVTGEPSSVKLYGRDFLDQFGVLLTSQEDWIIRHPDAIFSQAGLRWYYGVGKNHVRDFDEMRSNPPAEKSRELSTVCSSKQQRHTLHHARYTFVQELKTRLPELEIFGHGVRFMDDKAEALDPYRYHIAIENHVCPHHWTEKLADSFLGLTLPFYHGCPNAADYFPPGSFIPIDIHDVEGSATIIRRTIQNREYEKRLPAIQEARRLVMEKYNLFAVLADLIERRHVQSPAPNLNATPPLLYSRHQLRRARPLSIVRLAWEHLQVRRLARQRQDAPR
jgi:hypothetical protein